jgi:endonuclease YncB( thermonuclease family)
MLCALLAGLPASAADYRLPGRVLRVIDGDSLMLEASGAQHRVALAGIDAPELNQPWGDSAARRLQDTLTGAFVVVSAQRPGGAGGLSGSIEFKGRDVALDLLYEGLAWSTATMGIPDSDREHPYDRAERAAREARRGLWSDARPIPPWQWRAAPRQRPAD